MKKHRGEREVTEAMQRTKRLIRGAVWLGISLWATAASADEFRPVSIQSQASNVQPMTGLVLWSTNEDAATAPIQLEFSYLSYNQIVTDRGSYDWDPLEKLLEEISGRKHQAILRWHDTYVGKPTGIPDYIKSLPDYAETKAKSENKQTSFPDWSHPEAKRFLLEFFSEFARRYDRDPRIAFVQVGFGLWSEYHIYDGPMILGKTFPDENYQGQVLLHLDREFKDTPWMISVDAAGDHTPFHAHPRLKDLSFGVFDDSFNHRRHKQENEPNWVFFGMDRWKRAPAGGEFSFFEDRDQERALASKGPHGIPFEIQAEKFHVSFIIADDQPRFQKAQRLREAGMSMGYRFRTLKFESSPTRSRIEIENRGIAPIYYDAFPTVNGVRSEQSLKGLLPGERKLFEIEAGGESPTLSIECDRLVPGQKIEFDADLK